MKIADVLARKKPARRPVTLMLDPDAEQAYVDARTAQAEAQHRADSLPGNASVAADLVAANDRLEAAKTGAQAASVTFVFQSLGREAYETLREFHPPTKAQRDEFKKAALAQGLPPHQAGELGHNPDTFPAALIAAACIDPVMTGEEAEALWNSPEFSTAELTDLFTTALIVNQTSRRVDLGNG